MATLVKISGQTQRAGKRYYKLDATNTAPATGDDKLVSETLVADVFGSDNPRSEEFVVTKWKGNEAIKIERKK